MTAPDAAAALDFAPLRPLTHDELQAFRDQAYTLTNCGVFYGRGLIDACGRDEPKGAHLRALLLHQSEPPPPAGAPA